MAPRTLPGSMTARQFDRAAKQIFLPPPKLARARRVLVDGETVRDVATSEGVATVAIYTTIYRVEVQLDTRR